MAAWRGLSLLRLLCEREAAIEGFAPRQYWTVAVELATPDGACPSPSRRISGGTRPRSTA